MDTESRIRTYGDKSYLHTTSVRHQGTMVAFAMDDRRRIYYTVLDLDQADEMRGELDAAYWSDEPALLGFPTEYVDVMDAAGTTTVPQVRRGGAEAIGPPLAADERDDFLSSTARLGALAPFQVLSDGRYLVVLRQSVRADDPGTLYRLAPVGVSADPARADYLRRNGQRQALVADTILCDRFVLVGKHLGPVHQVRHQRSRSRSTPASDTDSLGPRDLDGNPFFEPTLGLSFVGPVSEGRFTAMLLPTTVDGAYRWQFFAVNDNTGQIDGYNVERAEDGLFNVVGTQFYTSPDQRFARAVLERQPGIDAFTGRELVPVRATADSGGTAARLDGRSGYLQIGVERPVPLRTLEMWVRPEATDAIMFMAVSKSAGPALVLRLDAEGRLHLTYGDAGPIVSSDPLPTGVYRHVAVILADSEAFLVVDGAVAGVGPMTFVPDQVWVVAVGVGVKPDALDQTKPTFLDAAIDEVRLWDHARSPADVVAGRQRRLSGVEPGLLAYYRFDGDVDSGVVDLSRHRMPAKFTGGVQQIPSAAPVGDGPGLSRDTYVLAGRKPVSGLSSILYSQQEQHVAGYGDHARPMKRQTRVMLALSTTGPLGDGIADQPYLTVIDLALGTDGRLARPPHRLLLPPVNVSRPAPDGPEAQALRADIKTLEAALDETRQLIDRAPGLINERSRVDYEYGLAIDAASSPAARAAVETRYREQSTLLKAQLQRSLRARQDESRTSATLALKQSRLAELTGSAEGADEPVVGRPAPPRSALDSTGLDTMGAVLTFAWSRESPKLLDSGTGEVVLYFRGVDEQFFAVYYDTRVSRLIKELPQPGATLLVTSRATGVQPDDLTLSISPDTDEDHCRVLVTHRVADQLLTETFPRVPRRADRLVATVNGTLPTGALVGVLAEVAGTSLTLLEPAQTALAAGAAVDIQGEIRHLREAVSPGERELHLTRPVPIGAAAGTELRDVLYDYSTATTSLPGATLHRGSLVATVGVLAQEGQTTHDVAVAPVQDGSASGGLAGLGSRWHGNAPGRAYTFHGLYQYMSADRAALPKAAVRGNLTLEAWVNPTAVGRRSRIVHANVPANGDAFESRYALGIECVESRQALSFNGSTDMLYCFGIRLDSDLTVEFWVRRQRRGHEDPVVSLIDLQTAQEIVVLFQPDDSVALRTGGGSVPVPPPTDQLTDLDWHHWAYSYHRTNGTVILYKDGREVGRGQTSIRLGQQGHLQIGRDFPGRFGAVDVDEVRLWSRARSAEEIDVDRRRRLTGQEIGLTGYWSFPDGRTSNLTGDAALDLLVNGSPKVVTSGLRGYQIVAEVEDQEVRSKDVFPIGQWNHLALTFAQNWGLRFDGTSWLDAGTSSALNASDNLSIEVFLSLNELGVLHGLVGRGASDGNGGVPYVFFVLPDGRLAFGCETGDATVKRMEFASEKALSANRFHRVAVTRKSTSDGYDIRFYIDGNPAGQNPASRGGGQVREVDDPTEIGRIRYLGHTFGLRGVISEVRLWNTTRESGKIGIPLGSKPSGLVGWWRLSEGKGNVTADDSGSYPARLHGARWVRTTDPTSNYFTLYHNGRVVPRVGPVPRSTDWGVPQLTLGSAVREDGGVNDPLSGEVDEVRIWHTARTAEQIVDNLFGRLHGEADDLVAYYPFDARSTVPGATLRDAGSHGLDLAPGRTDKIPSIILSRAPIAADAPEVRSALTGILTVHSERIGSTPGVTEYADAQRTARGVRGVLKRCYSYVRNGRWYLLTGYKVGDLVSEWVGQAQFSPQLVGYIEGAPPVPSENLVATSSASDYHASSKVVFEQVDEVTNTLSSNKEISASLAAKLSYEAAASGKLSTIVAPFGIGMAQEVVVEAKLSTSATLDFSNAWTTETEVSEGRSTNRSSSVTLTGGWEDPANPANPAVGCRWVPANLGFALVHSGTADIFALRLAHNDAVVAYRMLPNPDIPRDWNIVRFPINPRYTKQGSLDGNIGYDASGRPCPDPHDYAGASRGAELSYYKPREAYALKERIIRQEQNLHAFYDSVSVETHHPDPTFERANSVLAGITGVRASADSQRDSRAGDRANTSSARRCLANTYLWTAEGGFFSENTSTTDTITQTTAGQYTIKGSLALGGSVGFSLNGSGFKAGFEVTMAGGSTVTRTRKQESNQTFKLDVNCDPGRDLRRHDENGAVVYRDGRAQLMPGRVDAYRFMTFYLDSATDNFDDFFGKVVDPVWLASDPQAALLRQAHQPGHKPPCWRVLHRVTFVSRVAPTEAGDEFRVALANAGLRSDYALTTYLDQHLPGRLPDGGDENDLTEAIGEVVNENLPALLPHIAAIRRVYLQYHRSTHPS